MYYGIETRYIPATDHRGPRISARWTDGTRGITIAYDYALSKQELHRAAASRLLASNPSWSYRITGGAITERGYVFTVEA